MGVEQRPRSRLTCPEFPSMHAKPVKTPTEIARVILRALAGFEVLEEWALSTEGQRAING